MLGANLAVKFLVDRDRGLAAHLVVDVAQVGGVLPVVEETVEGQGACGGGPQPAPDQDDGDQSPFGRGPAVQVRGRFDLGHHVLSQVAGPARRTGRDVAGEEHRRGRQGVVPAVLAGGLEEHGRRPVMQSSKHTLSPTSLR